MYIEREQEFIPDKDLREHADLRGFYQSKSAPEIYLSKDGRVWSEIRETFVKPKPSKYRYPVFNSIGETYILHVILAETFIKKPESEKPLEVNHRDGNKNNYSLRNLEWVTRRENVLHAVATGLISKSRYCLLSKDLATGAVLEHESLNACARFIGCDPASLSYYLKKTPTGLLKARYDVIYKGGVWNAFSPSDVGKVPNGRKRAIIAINESDKSATIYVSATRAADTVGIARTEVTTRANGIRSPVVKGYRFIWLDEYEGNVEGIPVVSERPEDARKPNLNRRKETPIRVVYPDGRNEVLSGMRLLANELGMQKSYLQYLVKKNNGRYKDIVVTYV